MVILSFGGVYTVGGVEINDVGSESWTGGQVFVFNILEIFR